MHFFSDSTCYAALIFTPWLAHAGGELHNYCALQCYCKSNRVPILSFHNPYFVNQKIKTEKVNAKQWNSNTDTIKWALNALAVIYKCHNEQGALHWVPSGHSTS